MLLVQCGAVLASLATAVQSIGVPQAGHLKMEFDVLRGSSRSSSRTGADAALVKRDGSSELVLINEQTYYAATLKLGSSGDENSVVVDTGSSDLWVMSSNVHCYSPNKRSFDDFPGTSHRRISDFEIDESYSFDFDLDDFDLDDFDLDKKKRAVAAASATYSHSTASRTASSTSTATSCTAAGTFNTKGSTSFRANASAPPFFILYGDGTISTGFWGTDYVSFGSVNVSDCSLAVSNFTTSDTGVFGIGLAGLEATYSGSNSSNSYTYQNFPLRLKNTGVIHKTLYSLYLNSFDTSSGSLLFGAVDHAKYSGTLQTVPIVNIYASDYSKPIRFDIVLDSITLESSSQNVTISTSHIAALLDSGTTLTYLPTPMLTRLVASMSGALSPEGYYQVSCKYNTSSEFAVFNFSGAHIKVPLTDLILTMGSRCYLGVLGQTDDSSPPYAILGDNFLRHAYVVYDLDDYEISLAQAKYTSAENIEVVSSSVPSAVRAASYTATSLASSVSAGPRTPFKSPSTKSSEGSKEFYFMRSLLFAAIGAGLLIYV